VKPLDDVVYVLVHDGLNLKAARMAIHEYIEVFYNRKRIHSTNGNLCPAEYERRFTNQAAVAA
jgi:transposase InsO family protein